MKQHKRERIGPVAQKLIVLLSAGVTLSLTTRPDQYFKIIRAARKEWRNINQRSLRLAIRRLYQSNLIDYKEDDEGTIMLILSDKGKKKALRYNLDSMRIKRPDRWDRLWRIVIFDIPESKKQARDALALKMKQLGFISLQKSVFVFPFNCRDEIEFISEVFEVRPYIRFIVAKDIDIALDLRTKFKI